MTENGSSCTRLVRVYLVGCSSAVRYTAGLTSEPIGRTASMARLKPAKPAWRLPISACTSPVSGLVTTIADSTSSAPLRPDRRLKVSLIEVSAFICRIGSKLVKMRRPSSVKSSSR
ncbi:hypothetical protein D3C71_1279320 [compost metagenome]